MSDKNKVIETDINEEFKDSFIRYSMSVITDRSLPDIRDGLKPVHRRIIYDMMNILKLKNNRYVKSAKIVGDVIGNLHPHGDTSVYDAAARMTCDFNMRYPIIDGQGNYGSTDGDGPAAMRYTEMRPTRLMELMVKNINKNTVEMIPNFSEEILEPRVLPGLFPNLLCNGTSGIAVGMACNFPSHNLTEVCNGIIAYIKNNNIDLKEMMAYIPGPDFALGGILINKKDIEAAYRTGKSINTLRIRSNYNIDKNIITFTSLPYGVRREKIREQINKKVDVLSLYIVDFIDETNKDGIKIKFEVSFEDNLQNALKAIFKETDLESTFSINNTCLIGGNAEEEVSLICMIKSYVKHQIEIILKSTEFDIVKARARVHILKGLLIALQDIDLVISLIRSSKNKSAARTLLIEKLSIDEVQANAILDITLSRLTKIDEEEILKELKEKEAIIVECNKIINDKDYRDSILISQVEDMKVKFGDSRRTQLMDLNIEKEKKEKVEIPSTPVKILYNSGTVKIVKKAAIGTVIDSKMNSTIVIFTNLGMAYKLPVNKILTTSQNLFNILNLKNNEKILFVCDINEKKSIYQVTRQSMVKSTLVEEFSSTRNVQSIKLKENDEVIAAFFGDTSNYMTVKTKDGYELSFSLEDVKNTGRVGLGLKAIKLHDNDFIATAFIIGSSNKKIEIGKRNSIGKKI